MSSPRSPPFFSSSHPTSFANVTDPTLHRHGWRSSRASIDEPRPHPRKIPNRFRALLRYDALSPSPVLLQETTTRSLNAGPPLQSPRAVTPRLGQISKPVPPRDEEDHGDVMSTKRTNLEELKWFQHRWLDKHGKNSHMKESREKMALLRRWFESLDADGSGEVGLDELEDPLVSVGLARSRDEVQRLIDQVDKDGSGEVTFTEFLRMMNPEKPKRARQRQPLHKAKPRPPPEEEIRLASRPGTAQRGPSRPPTGSRRQSLAKNEASTNPVVKLFEDMQSGKLGDLAIPFPVLITAYRRRMLLNAHMSDDPAARRLGSSVLLALESTHHELPSRLAHENSSTSHRRVSTVLSPSSYLKSYVASALQDQNIRTSSAVSSWPTQLPSL